MNIGNYNWIQNSFMGKKKKKNEERKKSKKADNSQINGKLKHL